MQENTASDETSKDSEGSLVTSYFEGDVVPVTMNGVVVGKATVLAGGKVSVTLNDDASGFIDLPPEGHYLSFKSAPEETFGTTELCSDCRIDIEKGSEIKDDFPEDLCIVCNKPKNHTDE